MSRQVTSAVPRRVRVRVLTGVFLLLLWLGVSGSWTVASLVGGAIVVTLLMVLFPGVGAGGSGHRVRPVMLVRYIAYYTYLLTVANLHVARAVLSPSRVRHARGVVRVPLPETTPLVTAILANAVFLTPGTSPIDIVDDPPVFYVHVLELESPVAIRSSIAEMHWRLVRAIGPADRLEAVQEHAAELRRQLEARDGGGQ